jgi:geranylgeranyl diphosphate synthase type I
MDLSMHQFIQKYRKPIGQFIVGYLQEKERELDKVNPWGRDSIRKLMKFSLQGKMIRGGLIILSYRMYHPHYKNSILNIAAAIEIIHSSLLIHDDIMDRDTTRRGEKSIFYQYKELGDLKKIEDAAHFGTSLGICAGDIGFFLAFEILSNLDIDTKIRQRILSSWTGELAAVGLAQMQDVYFSMSPEKVTEESIIDLYRFKTARYSFSLPLATGAIAAGGDLKSIRLLRKIGEYMGIVFQIKDDELDLFGKEAVTGKPVGTDIKEGKKTLYYYHLSDLLRKGSVQKLALSEDERDTLRKMICKSEMNTYGLIGIRELALRYGIQEKIEKKMEELSMEARRLIGLLDVEKRYRTILTEILQYILKRTC